LISLGGCTMEETYFEVRANAPGTNGQHRPVHYLVRLEHPVGCDARLRWLLAALMVKDVLRRMPAAAELKAIPRQSAEELKDITAAVPFQHGEVDTLAM
jgi:hypothetical protein